MGDADRLSALDAAFLDVEDGGAHMHIGALGIFEGGPLVAEDGAVDFARIRAHVAGSLPKMPRYRQRLERTPGLGTPVWVDDAHFRLDYHVRHTALPRPGTERQLKRLAGRIFSSPLDRARPLWETWVVEGLEGGRFALVMKVHHALIDGMGGVGLMTALFGPEATDPERWSPRPAPSKRELVEGEIAHRTKGALGQVETLREAVSHPGQTAKALADGLKQTAALVRDGLTPSDPSPLNPTHVGPHRRFDVLRQELSELKAVKDALGGKLNDVVLATAAGGVRRFLERRGVEVAALDDFRALVPVDIRHGFVGTGNRVGMMFARLPLDEPDPATRYRKVVESTQRIKHESGHAAATELIESLSDWAAPSTVANTFRYAAFVGSFNIVITNVPGPQFPLELLGARLTGLYPLVPLFSTQALGIALFSYDGGLYWGLNADWSVVDDLHRLVEDLRASFEQLRALAD